MSKTRWRDTLYVYSKACLLVCISVGFLFFLLWLTFWNRDECAYYSLYIYGALSFGPIVVAGQRGVAELLTATFVVVVGGGVLVYGLLGLFRLCAVAHITGGYIV